MMMMKRKSILTFGTCLLAAGSLWAQLRISEICPEPRGLDPNGKESGWIELVNTGDTVVDLKDYKIAAFKRGKKLDLSDTVIAYMSPREVGPGDRTLG